MMPRIGTNPDPSFYNFGASKTMRTKYQNYTKFADLLIFGLSKCERSGQVFLGWVILNVSKWKKLFWYCLKKRERQNSRHERMHLYIWVGHTFCRDFFGAGASSCAFPTDSFRILEPHRLEISEFYLAQERRSSDFEALKLWKGRSGDSALMKKPVKIAFIETKTPRKSHLSSAYNKMLRKHLLFEEAPATWPCFVCCYFVFRN